MLPIYLSLPNRYFRYVDTTEIPSWISDEFNQALGTESEMVVHSARRQATGRHQGGGSDESPGWAFGDYDAGA
jgi:hypothetical protein